MSEDQLTHPAAFAGQMRPTDPFLPAGFPISLRYELHCLAR